MLHHIALGARDVARLSAFYQQSFGLAECAQHHTPSGALRSSWLTLGAGAVLMIEQLPQDAAPRPQLEGVSPGPFLLAFAIAPDAREAWEQRHITGGGVIEARSSHSSYARDCEGNRVAVSHYPLPVSPR